MHFMMPALKRAHLMSLAMVRKVAERFGVTPARFDLMHFVGSQGTVRQFEICRALGVSAVTVSRMVRRLAELGLVTREASESGRKKWVTLTSEGEWRVGRVVDRVLVPGRFRFRYERAFGEPSVSTLVAVDEIYLSVRTIAESLAPTGGELWHWYPATPGHPDD